MTRRQHTMLTFTVRITQPSGEKIPAVQAALEAAIRAQTLVPCGSLQIKLINKETTYL